MTKCPIRLTLRCDAHSVRETNESEINIVDEPAITAIIADDHQIARDGVARVFGRIPNLSVVGEASDGITAIALAKQHKPTLMTLDIAMPHAQGIAVFLEVRRWSPETRIAIFTGITATHLLQELFDAGADAILTKRSDLADLEAAIPTILAGKRFIAADAAQMIKQAGTASPLTDRETQVLSLIIAGHTTKTIAGQLGVSNKTVDHHRANIMAKLQVKSAAELLGYAVREGLMDTHSQI